MTTGNPTADDMTARMRGLRARAPEAIADAPRGIVVDLREDVFSPRWWRGAGTLGVLVGGLLLVVPGIEPLAARASTPDGRDALREMNAIGIAPAARGSVSGARMAPTDRVVAVADVPERPTRELLATIGPDGRLDRSLTRAGVAPGDAEAAAQAVAAAAGGKIAPGTRVEVRLGRAAANGRRPLEALSLRARMDLAVALRREGDRFVVAREAIKVDRVPVRLRGRVGAGLYWGLREAGASPRVASDYLKALASRIDVGEVGAGDVFDLVLEQRSTADGAPVPGGLLYAAIERQGASDLSLVRWGKGDGEWIDGADATGQAKDEGMSWPVSAPISSGFGMRRHPILRINRMHNGLDFAAGYGAPIYAAADGRVTRAGWAGGSGRQVKIAHENAMVTSYSHMSRIAIGDGMPVRRGQLIGYVGSSGLSTGAHLHYEVRLAGRPVDPRGIRMSTTRTLAGPELERFKARLAAFRRLPVGSPNA
ncbi:M23 family metallopeptidase [Sphingomicrobium nitratireducens]|uniref:M23 family metallopeptidase n=1 Tax=Sphingomicrobium nitratireducens TaxID=2964666 RepID=UPI002240677E|nr:M23 family metallopeptidase [Sphingomicrobium nitratireducens]